MAEVAGLTRALPRRRCALPSKRIGVCRTLFSSCVSELRTYQLGQTYTCLHTKYGWGGRIDSGFALGALHRRRYALPSKRIGVCRTLFSSCVSELRTYQLGQTYTCLHTKYGWGGRIRTCECWDQNPVPCRLATPQ